MRLTKANYFSPEMNKKYFSASQVKAMLKCPAAALADYEAPSSTALLVGSYVDAFFERRLEQFKAVHPEILKRDGSLKADFLQADEMIRRATSDKLFMAFMTGRRQVVRSGKIGGVPFKIKMDVYKPGQRIVDLKTVKDLRPVYRGVEGTVTFADQWEWPLQLAIYQAVEAHRLPCYLAVITKESPPDIAVVEVPQNILDAELARLQEILPRLDAIKQGIIPAPRCECCAYCRATRKLSGPVPLPEFINYGQRLL